MQDHDQLTTPNASSSAKNNLLTDWWEEMYPREFLLTFKNYFFDHKRFFDEVFEENWDNKVKPLSFLFSAMGISLIIGSISPWGLNFFDEQPQPETWRQITNTWLQKILMSSTALLTCMILIVLPTPLRIMIPLTTG